MATRVGRSDTAQELGLVLLLDADKVLAGVTLLDRHLDVATQATRLLLDELVLRRRGRVSDGSGEQLDELGAGERGIRRAGQACDLCICHAPVLDIHNESLPTSRASSGVACAIWPEVASISATFVYVFDGTKSTA